MRVTGSSRPHPSRLRFERAFIRHRPGPLRFLRPTPCRLPAAAPLSASLLSWKHAAHPGISVFSRVRRAAPTGRPRQPRGPMPCFAAFKGSRPAFAVTHACQCLDCGKGLSGSSPTPEPVQSGRPPGHAQKKQSILAGLDWSPAQSQVVTRWIRSIANMRVAVAGEQSRTDAMRTCMMLILFNTPGTCGLALLIARLINETTSNQLVILSRTVSRSRLSRCAAMSDYPRTKLGWLHRDTTAPS